MVIYTDVNEVLRKFGPEAVAILRRQGYFETDDEEERMEIAEEVIEGPIAKASARKNSALWGILAGTFVAGAFHSGGNNVQKSIKTELSRKSRDELAKEYIIKRGGISISQMTNSDKAALKRILLADWNLDEKALGRRLAESGICSDGRGRVIMRTERHTAREWGGFFYADGLELDYKEWHTVGDNRVRPWHQVLNGEMVPIHAAFSNGRFVCDEVGCRCRILYGRASKLDPRLWAMIQENAAPLSRIPPPGMPVSGYLR
jgi:hypothetical protein